MMGLGDQLLMATALQPLPAPPVNEPVTPDFCHVLAFLLLLTARPLHMLFHLCGTLSAPSPGSLLLVILELSVQVSSPSESLPCYRLSPGLRYMSQGRGLRDLVLE